ncbi:MAG: cysteine desulfurase [Oscillospiraceae bacterium]|jgi:cysteine desulfurase|nr:cysteine desulfurase [Oscillospiraceae bacterium]
MRLKYFDSAASSEVCENAFKALVMLTEKCFANPSSLHGLGAAADRVIAISREIIAKTLSCENGEVFFTSSATESNNIALFGTAKKFGRRKKRIVTSAVEHPSVMSCMTRLTEDGFEIVKIAPTREGLIRAEDIINAVNENTCLVSLMLVNNENGYILPVREVFSCIKQIYPDTVTHCDAVQADMKLPVNVRDLRADLLSVSAHKIHAPRGTAALYMRKGLNLRPLMYGGGQESGIRPGTPPAALIGAFGAAVEFLEPTLKQRYEHAESMRNCLLENLTDFTLNSRGECSPYIVNFSAGEKPSEVMLHFLERDGFYLSSGSACSKGGKHRSIAQFAPQTFSHALRVSFAHSTEIEDVRELAKAINAAAG